MFITSKYKLQKSTLADHSKSASQAKANHQHQHQHHHHHHHRHHHRTSDVDLGYHTLDATQSHSGSSIHSYNMTASNSLCSTPTNVARGSNASTLTKYSCETSGTNHFDKLTDELILKIFNYMTANDLCYSCARVCRRWYFLTWTTSLWQTVVIKGSTYNVDFALRSLFRLISREIYCRELIPNIRDLSIKYVKKAKPRQSLAMPIESLSLNGCSSLTDKGLLFIARKCTELKSLYVRGCIKITDLGMNELLTSCLMLDTLDATGCYNVKLNMARLPQIPPNLRHLNLSSCHYVDDYSLKILLKLYGVQLTHLFLRRCPLISDHFVKCLAQYCPNLREISFSDCPQLTDYFCYELSAKLGSRLRYISLAKCERITNAGMKQIGKFCCRLRYVNIRGCHAVSDEGLAAIARGSASRLKALDIGKCDISDGGLKVLSQNCPNLRKLSVRECALVTDIGISLIAYYCRNLVRINMSNCVNVTVDAYRYVKRFCKKCAIEHSNQ